MTIYHSIYNLLKYFTLPKFNVLLVVHRGISVQQEPTECTIYFQFISIINLYMFRVVLLLIISSRCYSVHTAFSKFRAFMLTGCWQDRIPILQTTSQHKRTTHTNCCI